MKAGKIRIGIVLLMLFVDALVIMEAVHNRVRIIK